MEKFIVKYFSFCWCFSYNKNRISDSISVVAMVTNIFIYWEGTWKFLKAFPSLWYMSLNRQGHILLITLILEKCLLVDTVCHLPLKDANVMRPGSWCVVTVHRQTWYTLLKTSIDHCYFYRRMENIPNRILMLWIVIKLYQYLNF